MGRIVGRRFLGLTWLVMLFSLLTGGCSGLRFPKKGVTLLARNIPETQSVREAHYRPSPTSDLQERSRTVGVLADQSETGPLISLSCRECPLGLVLLSLREWGSEVETDPKTAEKLVTVDIKSLTLAMSLAKVCDQLQVSQVNNQIIPVARTTARRMTRYEPETIQSLLQRSSQSLNESEVTVLEDGLVIARGELARQAVDQLEDVLAVGERRAFRVELRLISLTKSERQLLSLEATPGASVSASLSGVSSVAKIDAVVTAASSRSKSRLELSPSICVVEGEQGSIQRGQRIPIPIKATTQSGAIETLRYQLVNAGVQVQVTVRQMAPHVVRLQLSVSSNESDPSIESLGATRGDSVETEVEIGVGPWAYVGAVSRASLSSEWSTWLRLATGKSDDQADLDILVRVLE